MTPDKIEYHGSVISVARYGLRPGYSASTESRGYFCSPVCRGKGGRAQAIEYAQRWIDGFEIDLDTKEWIPRRH